MSKLENQLNTALWRLLTEVRRRRRVSRLIAAWHLLRHGSVMYGVSTQGPFVVLAKRSLLVSDCYFDPTYGADISNQSSPDGRKFEVV